MNFEAELVKASNRYFTENKITALAFRFEKSTRFSFQPCDVLIDSPPRTDHYDAVECKSLTLNGRKPLYFSSHFSDSGKKHQIDRMKDFLDQTGRRGLLAVELNNKPNREAYIIDFKILYSLWTSHAPSVPLDTIRSGKPLTWNGTWAKGSYTFN